ncbi:MAG: hypothetical protein U0586_16275 [Candidatus Brocadiaceae bacterium]
MAAGRNHHALRQKPRTYYIKHGLVKSPVEWPCSSFHRHVKQGAYDSDWGAGTEIIFDVKVGHE